MSRVLRTQVLIIGGGINGTGIARDLALRGVDVLLAERRELGSGTTWASSGMIHGGLRYLQKDPEVTEHSCIDSGTIQRIAPHLVFRIPFVMPVFRDDPVGPELVEVALEMYDRYVPLKNGRRHTRLTRAQALALEPALSERIECAFTLDEWGVDAGVVFPTIGILWDKPEDPELGMAYARAYNRWQWDFASPSHERIVPIAHIPLYDTELALAELRRCLKLGFKGMFLAPEPINGKRPSHPDYDPIWHELEEANLPFCLHVIVRFNRVVAGAGAFSGWFQPGEGSSIYTFGLGGTFQLIPAITALVCDGMFDRFPRLKALVVEAGAGWVGYIMDRLDEKYARFGSNKIEQKPSEYFRRNVWAVFDPGERSIDSQCDLLGETHLLWGSDYPHIDSHASAPHEIRESVAGLSEHRRRLVLGENARDLFQL